AVGKTADLVVLDATDPEMAVAELAPVLYAFKRGRRTFTRASAELHRPRGCQKIAPSTASLPSFRFSKQTITPKTLGDRGFASTYGLPDLETLELRMVDVERLVLAGILVGGAKCLRLGPRFEGTAVPPDRMRGIEREVLVLGSLQQVEFDEARHLVELRVAAEPYLLERLFGSLLHPEAVHGNEHLCFSSLTVDRARSSCRVRRVRLANRRVR